MRVSERGTVRMMSILMALVVAGPACGPTAESESVGDDNDTGTLGSGDAGIESGGSNESGADGSTGELDSTGGDTADGADDTTDDDVDTLPPAPVCGDGTLDPYEECDDGNVVGDDECNNDCVPTSAIRWETTYDAGGEGACAHAVAVGPGGQIAVGGYRINGDEHVNAWVGAFDADGTLQWSDSWDGGSDSRDEVEAARFDAAGNLYFAVSESNVSDNAWVRKYDPDGILAWASRIEPAAGSHYAADLVVDPDGVSTLLTTSYGPDDVDGGRLQRYTAAGEAVWNAPMLVELMGVAKPSLVRAVDGGLTLSALREADVGFSRNAFIDHFDTDGVLQWSVQSNPPVNDSGQERIPVVTRATGASTLFLYDAFAPEELVLRTWDADGVGPEVDVPGLAKEIRLTGAAEDSEGSLVASANSSDGAWTFKVGADGELVWLRRYSTARMGNPDINAIAVAADDDIIVAGCTNEGGNAAIWMRRYAP